jgi:hypothetical protein
MGGDRFWMNLRTAARVLEPTLSGAIPGQDSSEMEQARESASRWFTSRSVDDFDREDFAFLESDDLDRLSSNIDAFRRITSPVPGDRPASNSQIQEAWTALQEILRLLQPHEFPSPEGFQIQYRLERELRGKLPPWIESFVCETGTDVSEDPAVWVWLNVSQEAVDKDLVAREGQQVRDEVEAAVRRLRVERWPYVRFRSLAELASFQQGHRR